ncbi:MAG: hypothetical protein NTY66_01965 [Candidatus Vogelbacteria bacterium]|nr:hypothetical protein [Candidatus Vogelbacteria bacterium]
MKLDGNTITFRKPFDLHAHLRTGQLMYWTLKYLVQYYRVIVAMPNIAERPICTLDDLIWYRAQVNAVLDQLRREGILTEEVTILYMIKLTPATTPEMIRQFKREKDVIGMKYYPADAPTTNAAGGIADLRAKSLAPVLRHMEFCGLPFSGHFQHSIKTGLDLFYTEQSALSDLRWLAEEYPNLRITVEHASTAETIAAIYYLDNVRATLTVHHMSKTRNDALSPHYICMPPLQTSHDRQIVLKAAMSGSPKFMLGNDSAIHWREKKECRNPATGIWNAPTSLCKLVELFEESNSLDRWEFFSSGAGAQAYDLPLFDDEITLRREEWTVPHSYAEGQLVPFLSEEKLAWRLAE